jgi:predicted 3-demethylubiquinone-9 3-methyltransferase (glyoxalase superfamily)
MPKTTTTSRAAKPVKKTGTKASRDGSRGASALRIAPCLWFDNQAEEAARFYTGIFKNSRVTAISRYSEAGYEIHRRPAGSVMTAAFELDGQPFTALNGGPLFQFTEAISLQVYCENQKEIDYYWERLSAGGDPKAQVCGWLKDKFGLSWQVVPRGMEEMLKGEKSPGAKRVMETFLKMKKIDIAELERAFEGRLVAGSSPRSARAL